ncbi:hypothetical protein pipiens_003496 [Culex pipiens pipiens]|uniref:Uncharacterized protein n=1 Tax=Culex pipiens pipiens TaxID=38569 RepID=A0ABD1CZH4_CULPP
MEFVSVVNRSPREVQVRTTYEADRSTTSSPSRSSRPPKADSVDMLEEIDEGVVFGSLPIIRHGQSHTTKDKMEPQVQDSSSRSSRRGSPAQDHHPRGTSAHVTWRGGLSAETSHQEVHVAHRTRVHDVEDLYENIKIDDEETFLPGQGGEGPASHNCRSNLAPISSSIPGVESPPGSSSEDMQREHNKGTIIRLPVVWWPGVDCQRQRATRGSTTCRAVYRRCPRGGHELPQEQSMHDFLSTCGVGVLYTPCAD